MITLLEAILEETVGNYKVTLVGVQKIFMVSASSEIDALNKVVRRMSNMPDYSGKKLGDINWSFPGDALNVLKKNTNLWKANKMPDNLKKELPNLDTLSKPVDPQTYFDF